MGAGASRPSPGSTQSGGRRLTPRGSKLVAVGRATLYGLGTLIAGLVIGVILVGFGLILLGTVAIGVAFVAAISVWIVTATAI